MTGNALRYSRPILSFNTSFDDPMMPHLQLLKEVFIQSFGTPNFHPKMQPYTDKVISIIYFAGRIWFRVYQIIEESGALSEIGTVLFAVYYIRVCHCYLPSKFFVS